MGAASLLASTQSAGCSAESLACWVVPVREGPFPVTQAIVHRRVCSGAVQAWAGGV